eukprot:g20981.t1
MVAAASSLAVVFFGHYWKQSRQLRREHEQTPRPLLLPHAVSEDLEGAEDLTEPKESALPIGARTAKPSELETPRPNESEASFAAEKGQGAGQPESWRHSKRLGGWVASSCGVQPSWSSECSWLGFLDALRPNWRRERNDERGKDSRPKAEEAPAEPAPEAKTPTGKGRGKKGIEALEQWRREPAAKPKGGQQVRLTCS